MTLTFGSLFTGIGGFDIGFERAGMECKWQVEYNLFNYELLYNKWPNVHKVRDVRDAKNLPYVDVICGGFPCQDVSIAKKDREGLDGEKSGLWREFARILGETKPKIVVIENVKGLLSVNRGKDFMGILTSLEKLGYNVAWRVLDSQYFGVPQSRKRVFIVASTGEGCAEKILFDTESMRGDHPEGEGERGINSRNYDENDGEEYGSKRIVGTITCKISRGTGGPYGDEFQNIYPDKDGLRRLTPLECERLQGFPDNWTDYFSDYRRYIQVGNAVTVNVAEALGKRIVNL